MRPTTTLPLPGNVINALLKAGFHTAELLFDGKQGMSDKAKKILYNFDIDESDLKDMLTPPPSYSAAQLLRMEAMNETIPTFCEALDNILGGGVVLGSVLQVCGPPGSGKTQFLLQLCVAVQIPSALGGLEGEAVFIDTESCFTVSRLKDIAEAARKHCMDVGRVHDLEDEVKGFSVKSMLNCVHYIAVTSHAHLLGAIHSVKYLISTNPKIKLVVVDSIVLPLLGFTNTLERTRLACLIISQLKELAKKYCLAVALVNDLTTRIVGKTKFLCPALGESVSHSFPQTLMLGRVGPCFSAVMFKSTTTPPHVIQFSILKEGVRDIKSGGR